MLKDGNTRLFNLLVVLLLFTSSRIEAQQVWADVEFNKSSVYVGEPMQVSISLYTETWFTRGVDLGNLNVKGAFSNYLMPTSVSTNKGGKRFSGVKLIYNVFPYTDRDIVFPALDIEVETPPVGDHKGVKRIVTTPAHKIKVKPIPTDFKMEDWLVASTVKVTENWKGNESDVKVGDVLQRRIIRDASNTVAELIPPSLWDSIPGVSIYPGKSAIKNLKTQRNISAQRDEIVNYLFEQEGQITIPELVYTWYNPVAKKLYKRTLNAVVIDVKPNDDLGMLRTIRDSLQLEQAATDTLAENDGERTFWGLPLRLFIVLILVSGLLILFFIKKIRILYSYIKRRNEQYRQSERYYFNQIKRAVRRGEKKAIVNAFYRWIDSLDLEDPTFESLMKQISTKDGRAIPFLRDNTIAGLSLKDIKRIRNTYLQEQEKHTLGKELWINPIA